MRVVLDTNIWLDWLVFDDLSVAPLNLAHRDASLQLVINQVCFDELIAVLAYPQFKMDEAQQKKHLAKIEGSTIKHKQGRPVSAPALPCCTDPDDQKFLELARDSQVEWLITKDKALLSIRRTKLQGAGFRIGTPVQWVASSGI